tara:strand:+ start:3467 stop:4111 length:645 start_codon:yes stop_codon:yes gene_type:complete
MALSKIVKTTSYNLFYIKIFFSIFILIFNLQSFTKADDIRDFQIEGMSIGDSLLDFYSEKEIKSNIADVYTYKKDKTFIMTAFDTTEGYNFKQYEAVQIEFKKYDNNYIIHGVTGKIFSNYHNNIKECFKKQDQVIKELTQIFKNQKKMPTRTANHIADKSGRSKVRQSAFVFKNSGDMVFVECYNWHDDMKYLSNLKVVLVTKELDDWLIANN